LNRLEKLNTFRGVMKTGLLSNALFILFIIVTLIYYSYFVRTGNILPVVEVIAYAIEISGFILMAANAVGLWVKLRFRSLLKIAASVFFLAEFIIMVCDFNLIDVAEFYTPSSKVLIISHCIFSAFVIMCYLQLDTSNKYVQISCSVSAVISMLATFAIVFNVRLYASVLVNSIAYVVLYSMILFFENREYIYVDCYGDAAKVYDNQSFFDDENK